MAAQVKLVRRRDFGADISSLSLFNYEDGFSLARDGWIQAAAGGDDRVTEAMTLHVKASSHDDLAAKLKLLDDKIQEVGWYGSAAERYGVWLRAQMPDESEARQAFVTDMRCEPSVSFYAPPAAPGNWLREGYNLVLERMPWWESTSRYMHIATSVCCRGAMENYGSVYGDIPSRIVRTDFNGSPIGPTGGEDPLYEFWMGFRTDRFGDRTNFVPVWDMGQSSDSTPSNDTTSSADGTAYGGYKWACSFGDPSELKRVSQPLLSVTSDYGDQRGEFVVLLRAKVGADTVCHVRLKDGFVHTSALRAHSRVKIDSTSWYLHALGTVNIPPSRGIIEANFLRQYGFELHASRTSGSNNLDMDCFILIPRAEGFIHVSGGSVMYLLGDMKPIVVRMHPNGETDGWWYTANMPYASVTVEPQGPQGYTLPVGAGALVLAGQRETEHALTDYVTVLLSTHNRYRTLRGALP